MPLLEKPATTSDGDRIPAQRNTTAPENNISPGRSHSLMSATSSSTTTTVTNMADELMS